VLSDVERAQAAQVTDADVARAKVAWREDAPGAFRDLLDAQPDPNTARGAPPPDA
jgi:hypothetical protein